MVAKGVSGITNEPFVGLYAPPLTGKRKTRPNCQNLLGADSLIIPPRLHRALTEGSHLVYSYIPSERFPERRVGETKRRDRKKPLGVLAKGEKLNRHLKFGGGGGVGAGTSSWASGHTRHRTPRRPCASSWWWALGHVVGVVFRHVKSVDLGAQPPYTINRVDERLDDLGSTAHEGNSSNVHYCGVAK